LRLEGVPQATHVFAPSGRGELQTLQLDIASDRSRYSGLNQNLDANNRFGIKVIVEN